MSIYDVTITTLQGSGTNAGFIDPYNSYWYIANENDTPVDLASALNKSRANRRYKLLLYKVQEMTNAYVVNVEVTGADANTAPTEVTIRFNIEKGDAALVTADENNSGVFLTGAAALKRCVARAFLVKEIKNLEVYDPTTVTGRDVDGENATALPRGPVLSEQTVDFGAEDIPSAEAAITVVKVS